MAHSSAKIVGGLQNHSSTVTRSSLLLLSMLLLSMLSLPRAVRAQTLPPLGTAADFAVLGASTVTNTGVTLVTGDLGVSPGTAVTGFPPGVVTGTIYTGGGSNAGPAQADALVAYNDAAGQSCDATITTDLGGLTLLPGVYCFTSSAQLTGTLTLNFNGNSNAVFIFKIGSTLTTASNAQVVVINGAPSCNNIIWQVGSSATLGTGTKFLGDILAQASITATTNVSSLGSLYALSGAVTLDTNAIEACGQQSEPLNGIYGFSFGGSNVIQLVDVPGAVMSGTFTISGSTASEFSVSGHLSLNNQGSVCTLSFTGTGTPDSGPAPSGTMVWGDFSDQSGAGYPACLDAGFPTQAPLTSITLKYALAGAGDLLNVSVLAVANVLQLPQPTIFYLVDADTNFVTGVGKGSQESLIGLSVLP
jgi:hypothetical protein